ncbi:Uncharacterized protein Tcan_12141 [Toxocara canis]|uniref:Major facilitator superfamily (MFS) profile domain-containing protein n=1 Tax=Toxocara canis TaxID=6265 RepID=A0A0B2UMR2_TOXCA|nr:Uncharacterized protein Tcan_12141 [Toxocara canis]
MIMDEIALKEEHKTFIVYPQRWYVLTVVCLLALSNNTLWLSYVTLTPATSAFYCGQIVKADEDTCGVTYWSSQIFQIVGVLSGIFGMYVTDRYGIRVSCYLGSTMNLLGAIIRVISSLPNVQINSRLPLLYSGQTIAAFAQPFFLCLSPKVAEFWFADNQRGLANALSFIANPLGVGIGSLMPTYIVSNSVKVTDSNEIFYLNTLALTLASLVMMMTFGISRAKPPTPPSASSQNHDAPSFFQGLVQLFRIRQFYIQMLTFGLAFAIEWSLFVTIDPMLFEIGYSSVSSYLISVTAASGVCGSIVAGVIVDRSKRFNEVIKGCYIGIAICASVICLFVRHKNTDHSFYLAAVLIAVMMLLGFFAIPVFPIGLELGVETTFPIAEATSSGILIIGGQLQLCLMTYVMEVLMREAWFRDTQLQYPHNRELPTKNFQLSVDFWCCAAVCSAIFTIFALCPKYRRLEYERKSTSSKDKSLISTNPTLQPIDHHW